MTRLPSAQHPLVAREGRLLIALTIAAGLALFLVGGADTAAPAVPALLFLAFLYRDPHRDSPSLPLAAVAAVNGRVSHAGPLTDPWLGRDALAVTVVMGVLDVHSMFSPTEGKIVEQWSLPRHADPEHVGGHAVAYQIRTDEGDDVVLEIARNAIGGSVHIYYQPGERVGHGRRIGYAALGCRVTVYVAASSTLEVARGDRVVAAATVVANMVHETPVSAIRDQETAG